MLIILPLIFTLDLKITKAKYKSNISSNDEHDNNINKNNYTKHDNNLTYSNHNTSTTNTYKNTYNNNKYINQLNSAPIVVIYKKYCPYSIQTLTTLTSLNYNFNKYEKSENPDLAEYVKTNIYSKYPAIFVDGKFFGGNDVLQDALKNKKFVSSGYKIGDKMSSKDNEDVVNENNISSKDINKSSKDNEDVIKDNEDVINEINLTNESSKIEKLINENNLTSENSLFGDEL